MPGPNHGPTHRSLRVRINMNSPHGFSTHSFASDNWEDCRDYVTAKLGLDPDAWKRNRDEAKDRPKPPAPARPDDSADRIREALDYWNESRDPRRTIVELYLNSRRLELADDIAGPVIRFNARIKAMVSLFRNIRTGEPQAVLRTYLDDSGRKRTVFDRDGKALGERLFKGPTGGAAIMLDPFNSVTDALVIGEGVETCLTGRQEGISPAWRLDPAARSNASPSSIASNPDNSPRTLRAQRRGVRDLRRTMDQGRPPGLRRMAEGGQGHQRRGAAIGALR